MRIKDVENWQGIHTYVNSLEKEFLKSFTFVFYKYNLMVILKNRYN